MHADDVRAGPERHDDVGWPYDSPFAWAFPPPRRKRGPGLIARILARLRSPSGAHHATPGDAPPPVPQPREPEPDGRDPMETVLDLHWWQEDRVRPYVEDAAPPPGAHRRQR